MRGQSGELQYVLTSSTEGDEVGHSDLEIRVGESLARRRQELIDTGGELCRVLEPAGTGLVSDAMRMLERQVCRIAVIGQIKAGKSSFINAFVQRPELLPTDVNPWTTAVTNLHFRSPNQQENSALFHFFAASEWEQLSEGRGKLRELTERLVPGFEPDLLRQHVSALRTRAAARLGPEFTALLGQHHRIAALSPGILQQYVCQGDPADVASASDAAGRYADVTKSADIYLAPGPFDYPVTVIDTPGTNDPFLVRDEITRRCLESADLYIVVLTARQALSASDVALLRILRGLQRQQIIVFLNRIDELSDIAEHTEAVTAAVRRRLRNEFPGSDIPLIAGSAWWGNCALTNGTADLDRCVDGRAINYLLHKGIWPPANVAHAVEGDQDASVGIRSALFSGSGLTQIYAAVNELLGKSRNAYLLQQMTSCFIEMARASEGAAREELQSLERSYSTTLNAERTQSELSRLRGELQRLQQVSTVIDSSAALFKQRQLEIVTNELGTLRNRLLDKVNQCASVERSALVDELLDGRSLRTWRFDSQPIRRELADEFVDGFHQAEAQLLDLQQEIVPHLRRLLAMLVPDADSPVALDIARRPVPPPRMMSLGASVAVDLDASWWSQWWKRRPAPLQRGREIERIIREEFRSVVDQLVGACERSLTEHVTATAEWSFGVCDSIARSISRRREQLLLHYESLEQKVDGAADPETVSEQRAYMATLTERLEECEALRNKLERIGSNMTRDFSTTPR
jgi:tRNA U34 5-carboxymethylaminomethyl modifying GTPase MnmE/TrmE